MLCKLVGIMKVELEVIITTVLVRCNDIRVFV